VIGTDQNNGPVPTEVVSQGDVYNQNPSVQLVTHQSTAVDDSSSIVFGSAFTSLVNDSVTLGGCAGSVSLTIDGTAGTPVPEPIPSGTNADVTLAAGTTNVLDISSTDLNNIDTLTFPSPPSASTPLLINVTTGGTFDDWKTPNFSGAQAPYILINFPDATSLGQVAGGHDVQGTIDAPRAAFTDLSSAANDGQVVAASYKQGQAATDGGDVFDQPFAATLSCDSSVTPTPSPTDSGLPSPLPTDSLPPSPLPTDSVLPTLLPTDSGLPTPLPTDSGLPIPLPTLTLPPLPSIPAAPSVPPIPTLPPIPAPSVPTLPIPIPIPSWTFTPPVPFTPSAELTPAPSSSAISAAPTPSATAPSVSVSVSTTYGSGQTVAAAPQRNVSQHHDTAAV
jgi:choice-of-anchor A domain-containing protein